MSDSHHNHEYKTGEEVTLAEYNRMGFILTNSIAILVKDGTNVGIGLECQIFPHIHGPKMKGCIIASLRMTLPDGGEIVVDADSLVHALSTIQEEYDEMVRVKN